MEDGAPIPLHRNPRPGGLRQVRKSGGRDFGTPTVKSGNRRTAFFSRPELDQILGIYGAMVAAGEWRDYAIGSTGEAATFAVYRDAGRVPLFRFVKHVPGGQRPTVYSIVSASGQVLSRTPSLGRTLAFFRRTRLRLVVGG